jgi:hypothetical protein
VAAVLGGKGAERTKVAGGDAEATTGKVVRARKVAKAGEAAKEAVRGVAADLVSLAGGVEDLPKEVVLVERVAVVVRAEGYHLVACREVAEAVFPAQVVRPREGCAAVVVLAGLLPEG